MLQGRREIDDESNGGGRGITVLVDGEGNGGVGNEEAGQQPAAGGAIPRSGVGKRIAIERQEGMAQYRRKTDRELGKKTAFGWSGVLVVGGKETGRKKTEVPWAPGEGAGRAVSGRDRARARVWNTSFYTQSI